MIPTDARKLGASSPNYEYERTKDDELTGQYPDKDNHSIDSVRYALNPVWKRRGL